MPMKAGDYSRSVTIDPILLEPTEIERRRSAQMAESAAAMGYSSRLALRKIARDCGLAELPGATIYVGGRGGPMAPWRLPAEDLTVLLPGEEP
jgi:hypothetical protein